MTVLTFPSTGFKSDKVPLVDHVDADAASVAAASQSLPPPPPYDPKLLESGGVGECGGDGPRRCDRYRRWTCRGAKLLLALLACALVVWLSRESFCNAYKDGASASGLRRGAAADGGVDDDDDAAAAAVDAASSSVPCKSYTSYAAAENDMMMPPPPPPSPSVGDYDASQFDAMEDVYKKLEDFALNKALAARDDDRKDGGDVVSVFNEDFEITAEGRRRDGESTASPVLVTKSARFIHDFSVNVTGIVDVEGRRCFVMPLVRNSVSPPASLYDLLLKMSSGYYSMDITKVMADMRVVKPALDDLSDYGLYISKDCADYSTFKLEKVIPVPTARV